LFSSRKEVFIGGVIMLSNTMEREIKKLPCILSIDEVKDFFLITRLTVYRLIYRHELSAYKDEEGKWCILRSDLQKYCSKNCNL